MNEFCVLEMNAPANIHPIPEVECLVRANPNPVANSDVRDSTRNLRSLPSANTRAHTEFIVCCPTKTKHAILARTFAPAMRCRSALGTNGRAIIADATTAIYEVGPNEIARHEKRQGELR